MRNRTALCLAAALLCSCSGDVVVSGELDSCPEIYPDYAEVTVPSTIAPLSFRLKDVGAPSALRLESGAVSVTLRGSDYRITEKDWRALTSGGDIKATVLQKVDGRWLACKPFHIYVSDDPIDEKIAYRLIEPGYETWNNIGLYMRELSTYDETPIITNEGTGRNCMNCHSFAGRDASSMVFHMRADHGGTYVIRNGKVEKLNTKTPQTISAVVYPQWSNDGRYIAFSCNDISQVFHSTNPNRAEIYDSVSDVVVYDVNRHEIVSCPLLMQEDVLETFPSFSPDGRTLYFCTSPRHDVPKDYKDIRYSICSIPFDPETREFGTQTDTLYNASETGLCAVMPRVSPDGRWLLFTQTAYGCFPIWHKDSDLWVIDLTDGSAKPLEGANSDDVDSYHSWSGNGRWVVFSSRRMDGLYTRPHITHIDENGNATKAFPVPQKSSDFYHDFLKSFNIPEFVNGSVGATAAEITASALNDKGTDLTFVE